MEMVSKPIPVNEMIKAKPYEEENIFALMNKKVENDLPIIPKRDS
jgi:hypothetical protein